MRCLGGEVPMHSSVKVSTIIDIISLQKNGRVARVRQLHMSKWCVPLLGIPTLTAAWLNQDRQMDHCTLATHLAVSIVNRPCFLA